MNKKDFLKKLSNQLSDDEYTSITLSDDDDSISSFVDTGSYAYNALVSGSIYKGIPGNRVTTLVGESNTGKCARGTETIEIYCDEKTLRRIKSKLKI